MKCSNWYICTCNLCYKLHTVEAVFLPDIGGMLGQAFEQANKNREQEYARNRSNIQTGTCNFSYKLSTVEAVFLPDIGQM